MKSVCGKSHRRDTNSVCVQTEVELVEDSEPELVVDVVDVLQILINY